MARCGNQANPVDALSRCLLLLLFVLHRAAEGYNLDTQHAIGVSGPSGSRFGYSVLLHRHLHHTCPSHEERRPGGDPGGEQSSGSVEEE
ncbi:unnamed protein product [Arctogadus glacialis]